MAQSGEIHLDQDKLCCSICLDLMKDPATIPCGHSYCMNCIRSHWDAEDQKKVQSCPQCRQTFRPRPVLVKNTVLAYLMEDLKKTRLQPPAGDGCAAGPEDVACDFCTDRKLRAVRSCLQCLVSYCEQHLQPHFQSSAFEKHKLVKPSRRLQENICSHHSEVMKIFCRTDQHCICYMCSLDEHKGHDTVSAATERIQKQRELCGNQRDIQQKIGSTKKGILVLQQEVEAINCSADKAVRDSEKIFADFIFVVEKRSSGVKQQIRSRQRNEVRQVRELHEKLQEQLVQLTKKEKELELLSHIDNHIQFLHSYSLLTLPHEGPHLSGLNVRPLRYFDDVMLAVSEVRNKLQEVLQSEWTKILMTMSKVDVLLSQPQPETRAEFLQYSCQLTMDPNTANPRLLLSEGNRKAAVMRARQPYPPHAERFTQRQQVLSAESLSGRCYWETEKKAARATVAVAYRDIQRSGGESGFGNNDRSWALEDSAKFIHNNVRTCISGPVSGRVGVYLDHSAGLLSFYSVSDTMTLLHRVQTTFTQPLYAGFAVYVYDGSLELCDLKEAAADAQSAAIVL
ncbi:PREDICTED: tripartite motif-containing protein 16-like [Cyprinodon variegatus]|uniref:tripartite motif-containing protein 16-like n=1 Tax=Cyprinodon variegatus TaxID=28743 RepID=UPI000742A2FA|nr:PREDICTED: tripartite motif-containing protein 16-like [Cyprinodon variegatus]